MLLYFSCQSPMPQPVADVGDESAVPLLAGDFSYAILLCHTALALLANYIPYIRGSIVLHLPAELSMTNHANDNNGEPSRGITGSPWAVDYVTPHYLAFKPYERFSYRIPLSITTIRCNINPLF